MLLIEQGTSPQIFLGTKTVSGTPGFYYVQQTGGSISLGLGSASTILDGTNGFFLASVVLDASETAALGELFVILSNSPGSYLYGDGFQVVGYDPAVGPTPTIGPVQLDASQPNYAPAKDGDAMTLTAPALAAVSAVVLDLVDCIDPGITLRKAIRLMLAESAGKLGIAGSTYTFRSTDDTKDRITATVDGTGQRTAMAYDPS